LIEGVGKVNGPEYIEFDVGSPLTKWVAIEEGSLVDEGTSKLGHENSERSVLAGMKVSASTRCAWRAMNFVLGNEYGQDTGCDVVMAQAVGMFSREANIDKLKYSQLITKATNGFFASLDALQP
jgi:hypothetical protein